ncbi:hypothetical protein BDW22DRAFT_50951 [Trametopsis cervina]|nr:hypothetical protein BDW22DRAFT_50951 [Trametopsis cervina]
MLVVSGGVTQLTRTARYLCVRGPQKRRRATRHASIIKVRQGLAAPLRPGFFAKDGSKILMCFRPSLMRTNGFLSHRVSMCVCWALRGCSNYFAVRWLLGLLVVCIYGLWATEFRIHESNACV